MLDATNISKLSLSEIANFLEHQLVDLKVQLKVLEPSSEPYLSEETKDTIDDISQFEYEEWLDALERKYQQYE